MQEITASCNIQPKKSSPPLPRKDKIKEVKTSPEDLNSLKRKDLFCTYCRGKNHIKKDCFKLKKKRVSDSSQPDKHPSATSVAAVEVLNLRTLWKTFRIQLLNGTPIKIIGSVTTPVKLEVLPNSTLMVTFLVTESSSSSSRLILGCDFLNQHKIVITIDVTDENVSNRVQLFSEVASTEIIDCAPNEIEELLTDINIDFDSSVKQQLISTIKEVNDTHIPLVNDDYSVKINLKDESIFAFSPRRFAFAEKLQIREIVDDLLDRKIIKESNSQNIARE
ncbi:unnamed protein product [Lasius platythorax]|uniref:Uncharacterized protein n=1 Tax=Lasius platythorax TaxID=488582 RepID=A0AAV2MWI5_9HYME